MNTIQKLSERKAFTFFTRQVTQCFMLSSYGFDTIRPCRLILIFRRNTLPSSSKLKDFNYVWNGYFIFKLGEVRRSKQPVSCLGTHFPVVLYPNRCCVFSCCNEIALQIFSLYKLIFHDRPKITTGTINTITEIMLRTNIKYQSKHTSFLLNNY
jgi:hypothetical protein